ncbi:unnamed protein product [Linum tenue]|uniref:TF-B3 domain-containing protein n=1 Tax=Linum tenue TaxID=586396 RepID=A0AAV0RLB4_9ROSI|nr:unnamed protein product [Linum tenue]
MVGAKKKVMSYEEVRRQRVEENKKRMEDLNLLKLAKHLRPQPNPSSNPSPPRARRPAVLAPARRSSRIADQPSVSYREVSATPPLSLTFSYQRRDLLNRVYASSEVRQYAIHRAEELQSTLDPEHPSFVKPMLQSHVTGGFWLGLPSLFCKTYLPKEDEMMTLIDEGEEPSQTKYLAGKTGLSGGWRGFAIDHELVDGDALVFQLVSPTEFKDEVGGDSEKENQDEEEEEEDEALEKGKRAKAKAAEKENKNEEDDDLDSTRRRSKRIRTGKNCISGFLITLQEACL